MLYKEKQNLTDKDFPFHKIFIIICASGFVPPTLEKIDNKRIEARQVCFLFFEFLDLFSLDAIAKLLY